MDRKQLTQDFICRILDNMTVEELAELAGNYLESNYTLYSDDELISEIENLYPDLLELAE